MVTYLHVLALVSFAVRALADKEPSKTPVPPSFPGGAYVERRAGGGQLKPAIDTTLPTTFDSEPIIEKDCGEDNVCIPDLQVHAEPTEEKFTVGTADQTMVMNVTVRNRGEASYLTQYRMEIPPGFEYSGVENYETKHNVSCSPSQMNTKNKDDPYRVVCTIGNPLPSNERASFGVKLTGTNVDTSNEYVEVKMNVNSTDEEEPGREGDNEVVVRIPLEGRAQLGLVGRSNPELVDYSVRNRTRGEFAAIDSEIGPIVSHLFHVRNRGPSAISGATLDIFWPSYADNGKHLLYLIDMPFISDRSKAKCQVKQLHNVNPAGLATSNEHVPPEEEEFYDYPTAEDDYEEVRPLNRPQRQASPPAYLQEQKIQLKEAVKLAQQAGTAVEYRGKLNRDDVDCHSLNCTQITCDISGLEEDDFVQIEIFSRLWANTLIDDSVYSADLSSLAFAQITSLPHAPSVVPLAQVIAVTTDANPTDAPTFVPPAQVIAVTTDVNPTGNTTEPYEQGVPWWLILLAVLTVLLILALITHCCWRPGVLKRNRHLRENVQHAAPTNGERYADSSARYAPSTVYSPERHGVKV